MSGDCNSTNQLPRDENEKMSNENDSLLSNSGAKVKEKAGKISAENELMPDKNGVFASKGLSKKELLDSAEFNKTIATWFGQKGFIAMRSFFRATVLNSLQKDPMGASDDCSELDVVIVMLIADYLVKNGKYFTMSVFSNEVMRPLVGCNPILKEVLKRIGKHEDLSGATLTPDTAAWVLRTLNTKGSPIFKDGIIQKYLIGSADLLSILLGSLQDSATSSVKERAVRDDDLVAAFSEGLREEMGKLHHWLADFNDQFVDVSGKMKKLISYRTTDGVRLKYRSAQDEQELWNQMVSMDEHLKKELARIKELRDNERRKLATYAKDLEDLHREMAMKLKSIQEYEKTLKMREKASTEEIGGASAEYWGRGDAALKCDRTTEAHVRNRLDFNSKRPHVPTRIGRTMTAQIMEENLELKAILREQNLRIDALTKKAALLTCAAGRYNEDHTMPCLHNQTPALNVSPEPANRREDHPQKKSTVPGRSLISAMSSALRRARTEVDSLKDEQNAANLQYDRLLHNKLSKRL